MAGKGTSNNKRTSRGPGGGRPDGGSRRVTPKGGAPAVAKKPRSGAHHADEASSRYTPPTPSSYYESPTWLPIMMFALLGLGMLVIVLNYVHLLPGGESAWYLLVGVACITAGIITATRYK